MPRRASTVLAALVAMVPAAPAAAAAKPPNPCLDPVERQRLLCPDLVMRKPFGLSMDRIGRRTVLRGGNSIDNVGLGPAQLHGVRSGKYVMRGRQRIRRRRGGRIGITTGARLIFKYVPGQRRYWKFHHAARFELWRVNSAGKRTRRVRVGPKVSYCLRDLSHTRPRLRRSPGRMVYPACSTSFRRRRVTIGTSVGWSDVYPPGYPEQWIDVTGLRGCFAYRQIADPLNGIYESRESNNASSVVVRLPFSPGPQFCPGRRSLPAPGPPSEEY